MVAKALGFYRAEQRVPEVPASIAPQLEGYKQGLRDDAQDLLETGGIVLLAGVSGVAFLGLSRRTAPFD